MAVRPKKNKTTTAMMRQPMLVVTTGCSTRASPPSLPRGKGLGTAGGTGTLDCFPGRVLTREPVALPAEEGRVGRALLEFLLLRAI